MISAIRLQALVSFANTSNPTWSNVQVSLWSTIEINIGIICACMPTLRLILIKFVPSLSSTHKATQYYASFGDRNTNPSKLDSRLGGGGTGNHNKISSNNKISSAGASKSGGSGSRANYNNNNSSSNNGGIAVGRSYTVQFHDADDAESQVQLRDLDFKGFEVSTTRQSDSSV